MENPFGSYVSGPIRYDVSHDSAMSFWLRIQRAVTAGAIQILWVDEWIWNAAMNLFGTYEDQDFSFTDCTSFVLA